MTFPATVLPGLEARADPWDSRLGALGLDAPYLMAPMSGISNSGFRSLARRAGAAQTFSETVSARALLYSDRRPRGLPPAFHRENTAVQLFGGDELEMAEAALWLENAGFSWLDLNFGCPVKKFIRAGAGAALLRTPDRAARLVARVRRAFPGTLSVKLRSGWDRDNRNAAEIGRLCREEGVDLVSVHGRTRQQAYRGASDPLVIRDVVESVHPLPVLANGDVESLEDARRLMKQTGAAGVLIGRAAARDPWIFAACRGRRVTGALRLDAWRESLTALAQEFPDADRGLHPLRKLVACVFRGLPGCARLRHELAQLASVSSLIVAADRRLEEMTELP